ncbi:MAG: sugar nucleotide-binding protein [Mycoplasmoidaceae bacterium]
MKSKEIKNIKFLILGGYGMAGSMIASYLIYKKYNVSVTVREKKNIFKDEIIWNNNEFDDLKKIIINFDVVINCIGILNRTLISELEIKNTNSDLPQFLNKITEEYDIKFIHLSTDCVFSGNSKLPYTEDSQKDGNSVYDLSKANGEFNSRKNLVIRTSIIGPELKKNGIGLLNWFLNSDKKIVGYNNWYWSGITTLVLAQVIEYVCINNISGLIHVNNGERISKYELLHIFNKVFNSSKIIEKKDLEKEINKFLINTRVDFNYTIPSYLKMIQKLNKFTKKILIYK